jgi:hypothetical protein
MPDGPRITLATVLIVLCGPLTALAFGHSARRRALALGIALGGQAIPFLLPPEWRFLRAAYTMAAFVSLLRVIDLWRDPKTHPVHERVWLLTALFDTRRVKRTQPLFEWQRFAKIAPFVALMGASFSLTCSIDSYGPSRWLRWLAGALFVYAMLDAAARTADASYRAAGIVIPKQHDNPVLARSVSEFWSKRWNINVHDWLRRHCYMPLARAGWPVAGIVAGFVVSAFLHAWLVWVPLDLYWAIPMGLFFVSQAALIGLERLIRVRRWPRIAQHGWTVLAVLGPSPLFVEPFLRILHST